MITTIDENELKAARAESLEEMERTAQQLSRRATPAKQVALAEVRDRLRKMREELAAQGLVA